VTASHHSYIAIDCGNIIRSGIPNWSLDYAVYRTLLVPNMINPAHISVTRDSGY